MAGRGLETGRRVGRARVVRQRTGRVVARVACVLATLGGAPTGAQEPADLTGEWRLNYELSDEPRRTPPPDIGDGGGYVGRGRDDLFGPSFGSGWGGSRGDEGPTVEEIDRLRAAVGDQLAAPRHMTITQDEREIRFRYDDGRYVRIVPDGREHAGIAGTSQVTRRVEWRGAALHAEVRFENFQKVDHVVELQDDGARLVLTTILPPSGPRGELRLVRVYDLVPAH